LLLTLSCEKNRIDQASPNPTADSTALIAEARQFFDTQLAPGQRAARIAGNPESWMKNKQPQWKHAVSFRFAAKDVVEVPLLLDGSDPLYTFEMTSLGSKGIIATPNEVTKALFLSKKMAASRRT
jgi:hypothetical protein